MALPVEDFTAKMRYETNMTVASGSPMGKLDRVPAIDGLRAVAVGMVFAFHAYPFYFPGGFLGVDIFFVISGFVITRALLAEGVNFRRFYLHRAMRILPPAIAVVAFAAIALWAGSTLAKPEDLFAALFSYMNWMRALGYSGGGFLGHFWSLAIEEQFYLLWPALLFLALRQQVRLVIWLVVAVGVLVAWQVVAFVHLGDIARVYNGLDTRGSQLLIGCLLAALGQRFSIRHGWAILALVLLGACTLLLHHRSALYLTAGIPLVAIAAAFAIAGLLKGRGLLHTILERGVFQWAGARSYAIYLWHYPLLRLLVEQAERAGISYHLAMAATLVLTLICAEISWRLIEKPLREARHRRAVAI